MIKQNTEERTLIPEHDRFTSPPTDPKQKKNPQNINGIWIYA